MPRSPSSSMRRTRALLHFTGTMSSRLSQISRPGCSYQWVLLRSCFPKDIPACECKLADSHCLATPIWCKGNRVPNGFATDRARTGYRSTLDHTPRVNAVDARTALRARRPDAPGLIVEQACDLRIPRRQTSARAQSFTPVERPHSGAFWQEALRQKNAAPQDGKLFVFRIMEIWCPEHESNVRPAA